MNQKNRATEIMNSLEGIQRAKAPHDGFAKIQQKLAEQRKQQPLTKQQAGNEWIKIAAVIALVVCSNIWAVSNYLGSNTSTSVETSGYPQIMSDFNLYDNE
ncbi:MAG: hypothetical protein RIF40_13065 [Imperialibacter sp.]